MTCPNLHVPTFYLLEKVLSHKEEWVVQFFKETFKKGLSDFLSAKIQIVHLVRLLISFKRLHLSDHLPTPRLQLFTF